MLDDCNEVIRLAEDLAASDDYPLSGYDYFRSRIDFLESIASWIEENEHATNKQRVAIDNTRSGLEKWLRN